LTTFKQPDPKTQTIARTFSYTTFGILIGAMIYLMTNNLISQTMRADWVGTLFLVGFGLIFANASYFIARRYMRKMYSWDYYPYITSVILIIPTIALIRIKGDVFFSWASEIIFILVILVGVIVGARYGIIKGKKLLEEERLNRIAKEQRRQNGA
jgi:hypothetical protein